MQKWNRKNMKIWVFLIVVWYLIPQTRINWKSSLSSSNEAWSSQYFHEKVASCFCYNFQLLINVSLDGCSNILNKKWETNNKQFRILIGVRLMIIILNVRFKCHYLLFVVLMLKDVASYGFSFSIKFVQKYFWSLLSGSHLCVDSWAKFCCFVFINYFLVESIFRAGHLKFDFEKYL